MRMQTIVPALAVLALAGCGPSNEGNITANDIVTAEPLNDVAVEANAVGNELERSNYSAAVLAQNDRQRNATFVRALMDANLPCEGVESSVRVGDQNGVPAWRANCKGGLNYIISIPPDGTAQIVSRTDR